MRKHLRTLLAAVAVSAIAGLAYADSPHFVSATDSIESDGSLLVKWKEAGLGSSVTINYDASGTATATCNCVTKSTNCPKAANKVTTSGTVTVPVTATSTKAGNITASATLPPPECPSSAPPTCGGGQTLVISAVDWTNISLIDETNMINANVPPEQSTTFFTCP